MQPPSRVPEAAPDKALRREIRARAIAAREALSDEARVALTVGLCARLAPLLAQLAPHSVGFCWPYRGEPDLTAFVADWLRAAPGRVVALPVVQAPDAPLAFSRWQPGDAMRADAFGIPVPAEFQPLTPEVVLVPVNAFDAAGYRLGYGSGFFDRTLAALRPAPCAIGVGFELGRVGSIQPAAHDQPLDWIVTERGTFGPFSGRNPF